MIDVETIFDSDREEYEFMKEKEQQPMNEADGKGCIRCSNPHVQYDQKPYNYNYCPYCGRGLGKNRREKQKDYVDPFDLTPNFCPCCGEIVTRGRRNR